MILAMTADRINRLCLLLLFSASLVAATFTVVNNVQRSRIFHQLDYEEGNILNTALRINHGLTPYPNPHTWPVVINPYGPLPYYLTAIPVHYFGASFAPARMLIIVVCVMCALLIGLLIHQFTGSPLLGASFALLFLSHRLVGAWMPILRVDFIALSLVLLGLYCFEQRRERWWLAVVFLALATFTKFSFVAAPGACFVYLLTRKDWKRTIQFTVGMCVALAFLFGVAILVTHGNFARDVFMTETSPMHWYQLPTSYRLLLGSNPLIAALAIAGLICAFLKRQFDLPVLYALFALAESLTAAKVGSNMNHLVELVTALFLLAGWFVGQMLRRGGAVGVTTCAVTLLLGVWALLLLRYLPSTRPIPVCAAIYQSVGQLPSDRILSEDVGLLVVNHKSVWISNPFAYAIISTSAQSPDTQLQQHIADRWFDYILLGEDPGQPSFRWSAPVQEAIRKNYVMIGQSACRDLHSVWVPAPEPRKP